MSTGAPVSHGAAASRSGERELPKLVTTLQAGYGLSALRADAMAGLTVAVVALPLSMAIAIASGLGPEKGLFAAVVGGFVVSALGGSRFQIGGPAGAFIVVIAAILERHGYDGLLLAMGLAGAMMIAAGFLRLGDYIKYIPFPVTVGFTAGIAVIIFTSQMREILGLDMVKEPAAFYPKLVAIGEAITTFRPAALAVALAGIVIILALRRWRPHWPGLLFAVVLCTLAAVVLKLEIATIGSRFGEIPASLPAPSLPAVSLAKLYAVFPDALTIALLGSIESLLSAVVADGMSGDRHRSNVEVVAQGVANVAAMFFAAMCVTGTIARTATNIRANAHGPVSGMLHAVFLMMFMLVAAPLAAYIPLAALGSVLAIVSWNMFEKREFASLLRSSWGDAAVLLVTFLLTVFADLLIAIAAGMVMGAFLFMHRMAESVEIGGDEMVAATQAAAPARQAFNDDVLVYTISGALFFGATARLGSVLERIGAAPRLVILDFSAVPVADSSAAHSLESFAHKLQRAGGRMVIAGAKRNVRRTFLAAGLRRPLVRYAASAADARAKFVAGAQAARLEN